MRWISKINEPVAIRDYLAAQAAVGHGLDYDTFRNTANPLGVGRGRQLREELTAEQHGLCAYTGAGIDARLGKLADPANELKFSSHNEHLKPQSVCRAELIAAGKTPGVDVGEDMAHTNIVAALLVSGDKKVSADHLFGASHRGNDPVPIWPTNPTCEARFNYTESVEIHATDAADVDACETIRVLNLKHETLRGWRAEAINAFVEGIESRADAERIITVTTTPQHGWLPEYCFAIRQVVERMIA